MGIVNKPNTFTGETAPQLTWLDADFDTLYAEFNGNIDDNNVKSTAAIQQSKIQNLVTDLDARCLVAGDTMTGALALRFSVPYLRFIGTEASAKDWRIAESAGDLYIQENTGTEAVPVWTTRYTLQDGGSPSASTDLTTKSYVDTYTRSLGFGKAVKTDDFGIASTSLTDLTGMSVNVTTGARRARVTFSMVIKNDAGNSRAYEVWVLVDNVAVQGGVYALDGVSANGGQASFAMSIVTEALSAAAHTVKLQVKTNSATGTQTVIGSVYPAVLSVEELPY
jgi:hypothetical protein